MLSKKSYQVLKYLYKNPNIPQQTLQNHLRSDIEDGMSLLLTLESLIASNMILVGNMSHNGKSMLTYRLTDKGEGAYLEQRRSDVEFRLTQLFAVIGAITGVAGTILGIIAILK